MLRTTDHGPRTVLHLDADAFFASVEQRDDRSLRGKPVAVGTGVVASCSYESRQYGVRTGMRLAEARRLCRELIVLPGEYPRYEQAARRILAVCEERTPLIEVAALDDLYLDLTRARASTDKVAADLRSQIAEEVRLSVSIGMGVNKLVANVATKEAKPGHQVHVPAGEEPEYLAPWPARVLPGVGPKVEAKLDQLNVQRVGTLAEVPVPILRGLFGKQGRALHDQSLGIDPRPVQPRKPPQSVSRRSSFDPPVADWAFLFAMLDYLVERTAAWMRFQNVSARGLKISIRYGDYESADGHCSFRRPTGSEQEIKDAARERLGLLYQRRLPLRLLGIELSPLTPPDRQPALFADEGADRVHRLAECKDAIRRRFGFTSLLSGSALLLARDLPRDRNNFQMRTPCLTR
jgi:DNA polymerase-4